MSEPIAGGENSSTETIACTPAAYARHGTLPTPAGKIQLCS